MSEDFFKNPILNSPYEYPSRHWELDSENQPTQRIIGYRRSADFITPIPKARKRKGTSQQAELQLGDDKGISSDDQQYTSSIINALRQQIDRWRQIPDPAQWKVTPETARLLQHWRHHDFQGIRPFFCQVEAAETLIWLTEVAPKSGKLGKDFLDYFDRASRSANPELLRIALKLATGAGKTTVMAMVIAWQTVNAVRRPSSKNFTRGFLVVAPGITIRDRLRVLLPNDTESYYDNRQLVPADMLPDLGKAKIVITNYHAFQLRERMNLAAGNRALLQGRSGKAPQTRETEGQMIQRVMPELMGMKNILVLNDEAHHCYREKPGEDGTEDLKGDEKKEAQKNNEAARLWISGLEIVNRKLGLSRVVDLSATPFFLKGSGYAEGTLFHWTASDFSLMDALESGIVKLPRVPVADNIPGSDFPMYRNLWEHIRKKMPKKGRGKSGVVDPLSLPTQLQTALDVLYGHYVKTFELWREEGIPVPPCFIVVCNNTATSKLVYDYISGFDRVTDEGDTEYVPGRLELFRNADANDNPLARPNSLLIDSLQLESGEALDGNFREISASEIEKFRYEIVQRTGNQEAANKITDSDLLREVMNTVGKEGKLGESIRCVVSVSMLTEGWDANNVTHILGVRAFGTQLLCEQVIGRALRRQSYEVNEENKFNTEYADILGIPFDFTAKPTISKPQKPRKTTHIKAVRPDRDALEIRFPRVAGYRLELPDERITARFEDDDTLILTPDLIGATKSRNEGIIGEGADMTLEHTGDVRQSTLIMKLTNHLLQTTYRDPGEPPKLHLFGQLKRVARQWLDKYLECKGGTYPAQLQYKALADMASEKIMAGILRAGTQAQGQRIVKVILDPYNPEGSTHHVNFQTSKDTLYQTDPRKCPVNHVVLDSDWEAEFCRVAEAHPKVLAYVKNHNLGLEVPYRYGSENRKYIPDFIVLVDDGKGLQNPLRLVVEIKGYRGENAKVKKSTMDTFWIPGVNQAKQFGRWAFAEFTDVWEIETEFGEKLEQHFSEMLAKTLAEK